jgi:Tfp pilus assembly protein PilN
MKLINKTAIFVLLSGSIFLFYACGAGYKEAASAAYESAGGQSRVLFAADSPAAASGEAELPFQAADGPLPGAEQTRKLVKQAELSIRTEDLQAVEKRLADLMQKYGAWSSSTRLWENSSFYTLRVPSSAYDVMLADLIGIGKLLRRSESAEDVTLKYYDLEGRLATKQELLKTFQSYLGKAGSIEEIMTVEQKIAELQQDIEWTGTQLRNLAHLVDYSTIELEIMGPASASSYPAPTLGERLGELFGSFGETASGALVVLVGILIYGVPALLILIVLFWIFFGKIGLFKKLWRLAAGKK